MRGTRERLIDATFDEVYQKGYNSASLANILEKAETKKGSLYHYFPSKKAMVLAMIEEKFQIRVEDYWRDLNNCDKNTIDTLILILKSRDKNFKNGCPLGNILQECTNLDKDFIQLINKIFGLWEELFQKAILKAIVNKEIKNVNASEVAIFLIAIYEGAILLSKKSASPKEYDICIKQLEYFLNSLKTK